MTKTLYKCTYLIFIAALLLMSCKKEKENAENLIEMIKLTQGKPKEELPAPEIDPKLIERMNEEINNLEKPPEEPPPPPAYK